MNNFVTQTTKCFFILFLTVSLFLFPVKKDELDAINKKINDIQQKLNNLRKEKRSILNEIYEIELKYEKRKIENNKIKFKLNETQEKINKKEIEKKKLEVEIEKSKEIIKKILRTLYKMRGNIYVIFFLKVNDSDQLFRNFGLFKSLVENQSGVINRIKLNIQSLEKVKSELKIQYSNLLRLNQLKEQNLRNISYLKRSKLGVIQKINNDRRKYEKLLVELNIEAERLNALIYNKRIKREIGFLDINKLKGKLVWPIQGKVISFFGKKRSTIFNTYVFNNGIEIKPSVSDKVQAIFAGEIVFADYFKGYGNLIIVQHSEDFYSLYGHCEKFLKKMGDKVDDMEPIAIVGDTGSIVGKSLYFEIRKKLKPQNPLKWLRKR